MKKQILVLIFLSFNFFLIFSVKLNYKFIINNPVIINADISLVNKLNGQFLGTSNISEVSSLNVKSYNDNKASIVMQTYTIEERNIIEENKKIINNKIIYNFQKDQNGKTFGLSSKNGLHDFPRFPSYDLSIGDSWNLSSDFSFSLFNKNLPSFNGSLEIHYELSGIKKSDDKELALISAYAVTVYDYSQSLSNNDIQKIAIFNKFLIEFDINQGLTSTIDENFEYFIIMNNNSVIETKGESKTIYRSSKYISSKDVEEIKEKVKEDKDVTVELKENKNLSFSLENLRFEADTSNLLPGELKRLDNIASILSEKYRFNKIIITGHTADIGHESAQKKLSIERAKVIYDYLVGKYNFDQSLISFTGKGSEEPVSDNSTEEGRIKNRRVEIVIIPN
jgi:outer membrane protein OmpA-like peptidoglycan-associated protein